MTTKMNYKEAIEYFNTLPKEERNFICECANADIFALTSKGKLLTNRQRRNKYTSAINTYAEVRK